jgi:hypothetical protein
MLAVVALAHITLELGKEELAGEVMALKVLVLLGRQVQKTRAAAVVELLAQIIAVLVALVAQVL